jgi:23S rRNA-/tRNA-specific pseudouridylate synthase
MRFINHPIISDSLYAASKPQMLGFKRVALHAYSLDFELPGGEKLSIQAPMPKDFERVIKAYKLPL